MALSLSGEQNALFNFLSNIIHMFLNESFMKPFLPDLDAYKLS